MNTPIQGTAADLIKLAMIRVEQALNENYPEAQLLLQVHDELIVESAKQDAARMFARAIFGTEQSDKLFHFYDCDPITLITACGVYFRSQLSKKITKAQKK